MASGVNSAGLTGNAGVKAFDQEKGLYGPMFSRDERIECTRGARSNERTVYSYGKCRKFQPHPNRQAIRLPLSGSPDLPGVASL
jgi:hypothetical protein